MSEKDEIEQRILNQIEKEKEINSLALAVMLGLPHDSVVSCLKSLECRERICTSLKRENVISLTDMGQEVLEKGSPEYRILITMTSALTTKKDLEKTLGEKVTKNGINECMKKKLLKIVKKDSKMFYTKTNETIEKDGIQNDLKKIKESKCQMNVLSAETIKELKRRKLIKITAQSSFDLTKGLFFAKETKTVSALTSEMIKSGEWKVDFKEYNLEAKGIPPDFGVLHPLLKVRTEFRMALLEMGFEEMDTSSFVETSFWNFDSLFQPQQHPARDAHDTFFLERPTRSKISGENDYVKKVADMHENGGDISFGWKYKWSLDEASKNILRTHTTASSSKMLYRFAQEKPFRPRRCFSINRVFRNETIDATHLAEFHQVEGFMIDRDLSLANLMAMVTHFFRRIGIENLRFKPAYNPYTEPSMEIFGFSEELEKWIEVGNSGMFRPEMLIPMGFPPDVKAVAWGFSLERPTMIKYGIGNIRDLFGHKMDFNAVRRNPEIMFASE